MVCDQAMSMEQLQAWTAWGMCYPGFRVCSWLCNRHGKGKISRGEMISPDELAHYLRIIQPQTQQRSEPHSQEKGKEGKGKDKQTGKGKGKGAHFSGRYDRDGTPVHIFNAVEQMLESGHDVGLIRCGSSESSDTTTSDPVDLSGQGATNAAAE